MLTMCVPMQHTSVWITDEITDCSDYIDGTEGGCEVFQCQAAQSGAGIQDDAARGIRWTSCPLSFSN